MEVPSFEIVDPSLAPPRDVFREVALQITAQLASEGYRARRAGLEALLIEPPWSVRVSFHTSRYNLRGVSTTLEVFLGVDHDDMPKWRDDYLGWPEWLAAKPQARSRQVDLRRASRIVCASNIGNLRTPPSYASWQVADPLRREPVVAEVVGLVRSLAVPYLESVRQIGQARQLSGTEQPEGLFGARLFDLLMLLGRNAEAERMIEECLKRQPDLGEILRKAIDDLRRDVQSGHPINPESQTSWPAYAARAIVFHNLRVDPLLIAEQ